MRAGYAEGEVVTRPLLFSGGRLAINYATSAAGNVQVELQDEAGRAIRLHAGECPEIYGDELERLVRWNGTSDVSALAGKKVRLRVRLKDADLYAFRFVA